MQLNTFMNKIRHHSELCVIFFEIYQLFFDIFEYCLSVGVLELTGALLLVEMPCWYYEKKELQQTPSLKDGISAETEARYRRDGARFIMDAGMKMGL